MIKSMTGYGTSSYIDETIALDLEIKSVNSRYLDLSIRMPNQLNFLEEKIRKTVKSIIVRGRVDIFIRSAKKSLAKSTIKVDLKTALHMKEALQSVIDYTRIDSKVSLEHILKNDDVIEYEVPDLEDEYLDSVVISILEEALNDLNNMRRNEGENLKEELIKHIDLIEINTQAFAQLSKDFTKEYKEKLEVSIAKLLEGSHPIDEDRLANEIVFYADRADIQEEIARLSSHIKQFRQSLDSKEAVGKKLDFITQELLRETNTIGSKSIKEEITNIVIEQKTIIEKIKEQVQNIE